MGHPASSRFVSRSSRGFMCPFLCPNAPRPGPCLLGRFTSAGTSTATPRRTRSGLRDLSAGGAEQGGSLNSWEPRDRPSRRRVRSPATRERRRHGALDALQVHHADGAGDAIPPGAYGRAHVAKCLLASRTAGLLRTRSNGHGRVGGTVRPRCSSRCSRVCRPVRAERPYRRCPVSRAFGSPDLASKDVGTRCLCQVQLWLRVRLPMRLQRHSPGDPAECCRANEHGLGPFERCACSPVRWRDQPVPPPSVSAVRAFRSAPFAAAVIDRTRRLPVGGAGKAMVGCRTSKTPRSARSSPTIPP